MRDQGSIRIDLILDELYDEDECRFITQQSVYYRLQHSLVSMSKWESIWRKPFLTTIDKTSEEVRDYVRCMIFDTDDPELIYLDRLGEAEYKKIGDMVSDTPTATVVYDASPKSGTQKTITAELIYYWMFALQIDLECQHWHLNKLLTLIRVADAQSNPRKMSTKEIVERNRAINARRLAEQKARGNV